MSPAKEKQNLRITILGISSIVAIFSIVFASFYLSDTRFNYQNKQFDSIAQFEPISSEDKDLVGGASKRCAPPLPTCKNNSENIYNVKSYQAKGDGVTDDSAAVQSAINAAAMTCGIVFFPDGAYKLNILLPTCVSLQGSARGYVSYVGSPPAPVRLISASDDKKSSPVIAVKNRATWFSIRDVQVYGKGTGSADRGIYIQDGSHGIIERVTVMNCAEEAIRWEKGLGLVLRDIKVVNCLLNTVRIQYSGVVYMGGHDGIIQDSELNPSLKGLTSENMYVNCPTS